MSSAEAAEARPVSVSRVKRWVDEGILPAHKTAGGQRKLLGTGVLTLPRPRDLPCGNLAVIRRAIVRRRAVDLESVEAALRESLLAGQGNETKGMIRRVYDASVPMETIADRVIAPAMAKVGHQ